jgi:peroxiredoxin
MRLALTAAALLLSTPALSNEAKVGEPAPSFELKDVEGNLVKLADFKGKPLVIEWYNPGCPFVKRAHQAGGILENMAAEQVKSGVSWVAVNSGAPGKQGHGVAVNKESATTWNLSHPILMDEDGLVGKAYGAITTPQLFVVNADGLVVYSGAVDNDPTGSGRGKTKNYVKNALDDIAAGQPVRTPRTKPHGCSVKY